MRVVIQFRPETDSAVRLTASEVVGGELPGFALDRDYGPVVVAPGVDVTGSAVPSPEPQGNTVVVRGEVADEAAAAAVRRSAGVVGVFADPTIQPVVTCGDSAAVGTWHDVESRLRVGDLAAAGLDGAGVALAIVDTGINAAKVGQVRGRPTVDAGRSWNPQGVKGTAGEFPVGHGTMCAFDAMIAAPAATLLDLPVLRSSRQGGSPTDGLLSDALAAYAHLRTVLTAQPESTRALVVSNSWGVFSPDTDFPVGDPGNYSDNPSHPFNTIVGTLAAAGADILFAAGNCGRDCPDGRCAFPDRPINGANSHPSVLSVGGVDTGNQRVGYSSQGPGRLAERKPDVCTYTHFLGSTAFGADTPDTGTSAACPTAAGLIAAVRTRYPAGVIPPERLRDLVRRTALRHGGTEFDYDYGYGIADTAGILGALRQESTRA
ncbi:S8 family serine peptidase [Nocardia wallacei]|uniref:S8 family serine peptidase n=1 Tax=Nocardia wallacei TaxID=480035 RepID=UPI002455E1D2|nr:S8 family serine peptidase [Nocardia wallacei]